MKVERMKFSIVLAAVASLAACSKDEPSTTRTTSVNQPAAPAPVNNVERAVPNAENPVAASPTPAPLAEDDKAFITKASQGGLLEVTLGRQASIKGASADVKTFGDRMVKDHSKANDELKQLAVNKGVTPPTELDSSHKSKVDDLSKLNGGKFDKVYANDMVEDHEDDVKEFRKASQNLKDPELRAWASKTLPVLEEHLTMAKSMNAKAKH